MLTGQQQQNQQQAPSVETEKNDHGTAIGSLLLGSKEKDIIGLIAKAIIYSAAIFRKNNSGTTAEFILSALDWLADENIKIINMSLGGPRNLPVEFALKRLTARGFTIVSAAGVDNNKKPLYPAVQDDVITT